MNSIRVILALFLFSAVSYATPPPTLNLKNQYGETSKNYVISGNFIGNPIAANSIPANLTGSIALPVANTYAAVSAKLTPAMLLTGFVAGAGTVAGTDTVLAGFDKVVGNANALQAKGLIPATESVTVAGALSVSVMESLVSNSSGSPIAVTLAAPSSIDGQIKIVKAVSAMTNAVTLAMTNIVTSGAYTPTGTTTLTFTNIGDSAIFMAVGAKWVYIGGSAVAS